MLVVLGSGSSGGVEPASRYHVHSIQTAQLGFETGATRGRGFRSSRPRGLCGGDRAPLMTEQLFNIVVACCVAFARKDLLCSLPVVLPSTYLVVVRGDFPLLLIGSQPFILRQVRPQEAHRFCGGGRRDHHCVLQGCARGGGWWIACSTPHIFGPRRSYCHFAASLSQGKGPAFIPPVSNSSPLPQRWAFVSAR